MSLQKAGIECFRLSFSRDGSYGEAPSKPKWAITAARIVRKRDFRIKVWSAGCTKDGNSEWSGAPSV